MCVGGGGGGFTALGFLATHIELHGHWVGVHKNCVHNLDVDLELTCINQT